MSVSGELWIFGAGDLARLAKFFFEKDARQAVMGFIVDDAFASDPSDEYGRVVPWSDYVAAVPPETATIFPAVGYKSMRAREIVYDKISRAKFRMCNLLCGSAIIAGDVSLGYGNFIMPGVVIEPGVVVGNNNVFWSNSVSCHNSLIGNHSFIAANSVVGGRSRIGNRCFVGFSSVVAQDVSVCDDVLLGANSFLKDGADSAGVYLGSPAKIRKQIDPAVGVCVFP